MSQTRSYFITLTSVRGAKKHTFHQNPIHLLHLHPAAGHLQTRPATSHRRLLLHLYAAFFSTSTPPSSPPIAAIFTTSKELDLCALGKCSRFWRELCGSDHIWAGLCKDRWPSLELDDNGVVPEFNPHQLQHQNLLDSNLKGWRGFYVNKHHEMASKADAVIAFFEQRISSESVEVNHYLVAMQIMNAMQFEFRNIVLFFFKENLHVLLNLAGMHYCIAWLGVPAERVMEALYNCKSSDRQICVRWWKLGRWMYGFRLRDESILRKASLIDLAMIEEQEVLDVLYRGAIHEVIRVQISAAKPVSSHWSCQSQTAERSG